MDTALTAALVTLLPGDDRFPAATTIGLACRLLALDHLRPAAEAALARLPSTFAALSVDDRTQTLRAWEAADPQGFSALVTAAYSAYYTHPTVLAAVEQVTGYAARPPQPEGYTLAAFDEAIAAVPRRHGSLWRDA